MGFFLELILKPHLKTLLKIWMHCSVQISGMGASLLSLIRQDHTEQVISDMCDISDNGLSVSDIGNLGTKQHAPCHPLT